MSIVIGLLSPLLLSSTFLFTCRSSTTESEGGLLTCLTSGCCMFVSFCLGNKLLGITTCKWQNWICLSVSITSLKSTWTHRQWCLFHKHDPHLVTSHDYICNKLVKGLWLCLWELCHSVIYTTQRSLTTPTNIVRVRWLA